MSLHIASIWLGLTILYGIYRFYLYPSLFSPLRHIPKAQADWRFRLYQWVYTEPSPIRLSQWVKDTQYEGLVRYSGLGGTERVLPLSSDAVKEVLVTKAYSCFERPRLSRERLGALLGNGLLAIDDNQHRAHKRKLLPAFAFRHIRHLYPVFWTKACELVNGLEMAVTSSTDIELRPWTSRAALDVIGVAAWGKDFGALANPNSEVVSKYRSIQQGSPRANRQGYLIHAAALVIPMKMLTRLFPCEFFNNVAEGKKAIRGACAQAIDLKRNTEKSEKAEEAGKKRNANISSRSDILGLALSIEEFDDEVLTGHMLNILAAGHETSSLAATWACYLLCKHPEIQTRLRAEIRSTLPSPSATISETGTEVSADILENMPFLRAVSRESLRIIPSVPLVRREASKDTTILDYVIPAGTSVIPMAWVLHRSTSEWGPDAAEFNPERWLQPGQEATGGAKSTFSDLSFSTGPRSCIGEGFAKGEALALLAAIVGKFELELAPESDIELERMNLFWGIAVKPISLKFRMRTLNGW
ncbi:cytochrome P450 [Dothidotthia symphoricarpi CBS 119687]|uniref:Cytochrome P450 n=1 Tax=Dothidotthia symphoricarpi CBS 119687 TaxID=1392245 RepID=A0A6A6A753_9PLEO|nr:cytochrome P450 [Dothidotthia symphoricarpi CBS 119687]KAF2127396.1 cytochrome P450 [Dothidotthia symphoricarpi CBS 119687]